MWNTSFGCSILFQFSNRFQIFRSKWKYWQFSICFVVDAGEFVLSIEAISYWPRFFEKIHKCDSSLWEISKEEEELCQYHSTIVITIMIIRLHCQKCNRQLFFLRCKKNGIHQFLRIILKIAMKDTQTHNQATKRWEKKNPSLIDLNGIAYKNFVGWEEKWIISMIFDLL